MAEQDEDKSSKTEEPTERKLQKAKDKGNVPKSKEVNNLAVMLAIILMLLITFPAAMQKLLDFYGGVLTDAGTLRMDNQPAVGNILSLATWETIIAFLPTLALLLALAWLGAFIQTGPIFSADPLKPKLQRISLIKGFERLFSPKALMEFLKALLKMVIIGIVIYAVMVWHLEDFLSLIDMAVFDLVRKVTEVLLQILVGVLVIVFLLSIMDFVFQRAQFRKDQRMTRREIKDEMKESEGDPHIKNRQRQIRLERARARMMQEVPKADVVITNPTHFAVALRYDKAQEEAPRVVAKGADLMAKRIRELAADHDVPLYEDPPLARQLYSDVEVDEVIPLELYEAVAQVIAYVYNIRGQSAA